MSDAALTAKLWPASIAGFDATLDSPAENLALDEVLLEQVDRDPELACLRFWHSPSNFVVLGRSNQVETEVEIDACRAAKIPVLRRTSGGGTVIVGPGCLCYSLVLPLNNDLRRMGVAEVTSQLMSRTAAGLQSICPGAALSGTSDLVQGNWKFSGNAQRWLRQAFIHHGTLLFDFDLDLLQRCLKHPTREPAYRQARPHSSFVTNLPFDINALKSCLIQTWQAQRADLPDTCRVTAREAASVRYQSPEWQVSDWPT